MRALGFDNYEGVLRVYLAKYRDVSDNTLSAEHANRLDDLPPQQHSHIIPYQNATHNMKTMTIRKFKMGERSADAEGNQLEVLLRPTVMQREQRLNEKGMMTSKVYDRSSAYDNCEISAQKCFTKKKVD